MVGGTVAADRYVVDLSVLALSSRFDGRLLCESIPVLMPSFSTRSVESF